MSKDSNARFRRNKRNPHNCPKCGVYVCYNYQLKHKSELPEDIRNHQCDPGFLKRSAAVRDAVMDRDYEPAKSRPYGSRLSDGFEMLGDFGDGQRFDDDDE